MKSISLKTRQHQTFYFFLLCVLAAAIPLSNFFMSLTQILLCINWVWEGNFREKFSSKKNNIVLISILSLFLIHIIWLINSQNIAYGLRDIEKKLPLLAIPLVLFTSKPLSRKQSNILLLVYCGAVFGGSFFGFVRYLIYGESINYRNIIPFISHIRFSINICMVIFILVYRIVYGRSFTKPWFMIFPVLGVLWLLYFLNLLHSYTGILILICSVFVFSGYLILHKKNPFLRWIIFAGCIILLTGIFFGIRYYVNSYYKLLPLSTTMPQKELTRLGNTYEHRNDGIIENGNFIHNYICEDELREEWNKKSPIPYDSLDNAKQPIRSTLIRYLNSKGLTKDAEGLSKLDSKDIKHIERGIANIYYAEGSVLRKMIYVIAFEHEQYKKNNYVKGHSLYQRFELWKTSLQIVKNHFVFGVGTGDVADVIKVQLIKNNSELKGTDMRTHNQYITFLLSFGIVGFLIFVFSLFYAPIRQKAFRNPLFLLFFSIVLLSMFSEDTLETEAGVTFFAFFYSFFIVNGKRANVPAL